MAVRFHRNQTGSVEDIGRKPDVDVLKPGEYVKVAAGNLVSKIAWAFLCCPGCRKIWTLGKRNHKVDANGVVTPSDVCPDPAGCKFHEFITLDGWTD